MHVPRPPDDERVVTLEDESSAFLRAFQYIQNHTHRIVPLGSPPSVDCAAVSRRRRLSRGREPTQ